MTDPATTPANPIGGILQSLPIETMFWAPMSAAIKAQVGAAQAFSDFLSSVCMEKDGTVKMTRLGYQQSERGADDKPTGKVLSRVIDLPLLALLPMPSLAVEEMSVDFDLQVDTSDSSTVSNEASASLEGTVGFAWWKVSFKGSVTHKSEQTRKTDTRARYTVHMKAAKQPPTEALSRVIDFITEAATKPINKDQAPVLAATK